MTENTTSAETTADSSAEPEEIFNPFKAPQADSEPSAQQADAGEPAPTEQPAVEEDPAAVMFQAPDLSSVVSTSPPARQSGKNDDASTESSKAKTQNTDDRDSADQSASDETANEDESGSGQRRNRRKRRRGGRSKSRPEQSSQNSDDQENADPNASNDSETSDAAASEDSATGEDEAQVIRRKRRRRRGSSDMEIEESDEDGHTVTRIRAGREAGENAPAKVTGVKGSTRLEAKRQRRRASREGGRRRQIITEAEFLARREAVDRKMIVRQRGQRIQIAVLEDGVLAEHSVSNTTQDSLIGNVYLGKVQNVLPSMEAAFVDIGRGRNAVLYAGEVDWDAANIGNAPRKIENALKSGDSVLVQVTKDPVGHKGARLTSQVSLPGRYLVFVPGGSMTGISRKLPDTERARLKKILKEQMPGNAGVIVRTAAEGASEDELTNDINRLRSLWEGIEAQSQDRKVLAPELLYAEPDLTIKVVRDVFNEDFSSMEVQGEETWDNVEAYVTYVAPHLLDRLQRWDHENDGDIFSHHRIDEQLNKALERKVNLPSGGSLVFDRTEAMTVVDVNTGKFTGSGGNLEETVTRNNLEAAEEIVRQLRLRDIGGIIVIDFIDMVLEANRDLVLRRMVECLGRDRTKHQVAEVTSLGLVQMTRKRMGTGLLEVFSEDCEHCAGRGVITRPEPIQHRASHTADGEMRQGKGKKRRRKGKRNDDAAASASEQEPKELKKLENARKGLAQVAAATAGHASEGSTAEASGSAGVENQQAPTENRSQADSSPREQQAAVSDDQQQDEQKPGAQRRSRRRRGGARRAESPAGSAGSEETAPSTLSIAGEAVELPRGSSAPSQQTQGTDVSLDSLNQVLADRSASPERSPAPRRRRRAAGSAQGSGGAVREVTATVNEASTTFSAGAPEPAAEKKPAQASSAPVMLGVGVKAEDISRG